MIKNMRRTFGIGKLFLKGGKKEKKEPLHHASHGPPPPELRGRI
jgi:hypothetical protein